MASTTFVDGETLIEATWLNDVNAAVYTPGTVTAASITNVPAGNIAAINVQTALNELDTEKQPLNAQLTTLATITSQQAADLASLSAFIGTLLNDTNAPTALTTLGSLLNGTLVKSAAYTVATTDRGKLIDCTTGTWALKFDSVTLGTNFAFAVRNSGSGTITLTALNGDPTTALIDGSASVALPAGGSALIFCDGTNFETVGLWIPQVTTVIDATASRDFVSTFTNSFGHQITAMVATAAAGAAIGLTGYINGVPCQFAYTATVGVQIGLSLTVPPGATYNVAASSGSPALSKWLEVL